MRARRETGEVSRRRGWMERERETNTIRGPGRSPPFGQAIQEDGRAILRAKLLEKLEEEDVRDVLKRLRAGPL
ncbi:MAG: hypothetical protein QFX32_05860 [Methanolinea sp.]|nr:hypothetical protein [Methanolinea sp.]